MSETCYSCQIFDVFNQKTLQFCQAFFEAVTVGTVGYMQMLFTGALLWGAYGIIIGTPSQILNVGNVAPSNPVLNFIGHLPNKAVSLAKGHIPFGKK